VEQITGFHHVGITVSSLERSLRFYRDLLGFEEVMSWNPRAPYIETLVGYPGVDLHAAVLKLPNSPSRLELLEYRGISAAQIDPRNGNAGTAHIAFFVEDLDTLYRTLTAAGVDSVSEPITPTIGPNRGGRAVYMIDPDGIRVELIQTSGSFDRYAADQQAKAGE